MMRLLATSWRVFRNAVANTVNHDGIEHAGYLAFLGLLALFPFLVFMFSVIGVIGQGEAGERLIAEALSVLPEHVIAALKPRVVEIISGPPQGLLTIAILGAIWTASSAVEGIRTVLNRAYHVTTPPAYWFRRSMSVLQLLIFTAIMITAMLALVFLPIVLHNIEGWMGIKLIEDGEHELGRMVIWIAVAAIFATVSFIYYTIPNIKQSFVAVWPGALVVVALWLSAANLFTVYLSNFDQVNLIYGSLGGIIAALLFFYICNVIFIFGAELNYQITHALGHRVIEKQQGIDE
jgi:membrane protein